MQLFLFMYEFCFFFSVIYLNILFRLGFHVHMFACVCVCFCVYFTYFLFFMVRLVIGLHTQVAVAAGLLHLRHDILISIRNLHSVHVRFVSDENVLVHN